AGLRRRRRPQPRRLLKAPLLTRRRATMLHSWLPPPIAALCAFDEASTRASRVKWNVRSRSGHSAYRVQPTRQFDDGLGMMAVLEQRILDGLGSIDEQATIKPILLQRDPLAAPVSADEYDGRGSAARGRFDEF